ncbi:MAG: hypothetical protein ACO3FE_14705, partial [Planctomycetaceae bacterium]
RGLLAKFRTPNSEDLLLTTRNAPLTGLRFSRQFTFQTVPESMVPAQCGVNSLNDLALTHL